LSRPLPRTAPSTLGTALTTAGRAEVIGATILAIMFPTPFTTAGADRTGAGREAATGLTLLMTPLTIAGTGEATIELTLLRTPFMTAATDVTKSTAIAVTSLTTLGMRL
jgi:hypothetical protein